MSKVELKAEPVGKAGLFKKLLEVEKILNKKFDVPKSLVRLGDKVNIMLPSIPTGLYTFDYGVIGTGGVPRGRIIEFFGPESSGKTTLALHVIGCEQRTTTDKLCGFVDAEHALDPTYAHKLGVDVDNLVVSQPDSGEQALETVEEMINSGLFSLIVVDSVAALVPQAELDGEMGDSHMGLQARLMSQAMRKLNGIAFKNNVTVIFINQIREKIGVMFGSPETTSGGRALKFFASVRIDIRRKEYIKSGTGDNAVNIGQRMKLKAVKNKAGAPFRETLIDLIFESGCDTMADMVEYAVKVGAIEQAGAWYKFNGENIGQGMDNAKDTLRADEKLQQQVKAEVLKAIEEHRKQ